MPADGGRAIAARGWRARRGGWRPARPRAAPVDAEVRMPVPLPRRRSAVTCMVMLVTSALASLAAPSGYAQARDDQVDLLLVLAADISRSVDERKFRLQREGYA